jgi:hypothetical protein
MGQPQHPLPAALPEAPAARHLGDLARSDERWQVYLETRAQGRTVAGRVHFVQAEQTRSSAWILLEWSEQEVQARFNEFSAVELWRLVESLG